MVQVLDTYYFCFLLCLNDLLHFLVDYYDLFETLHVRPDLRIVNHSLKIVRVLSPVPTDLNTPGSHILKLELFPNEHLLIDIHSQFLRVFIISDSHIDFFPKWNIVPDFESVLALHTEKETFFVVFEGPTSTPFLPKDHFPVGEGVYFEEHCEGETAVV